MNNISKSPAYSLHKLVFTLDRRADKLLEEHFNISHKRALFLVVLQLKPATQHELALALGYTDPAVSSMLAHLAKDGYVTIQPDPSHLRKRIVSLTPAGSELAMKAKELLDRSFAHLLEVGNVNGDSYQQQTERIYQALITNEGDK